MPTSVEDGRDVPSQGSRLPLLRVSRGVAAPHLGEEHSPISGDFSKSLWCHLSTFANADDIPFLCNTSI